jgi:hypothetical protein
MWWRWEGLVVAKSIPEWDKLKANFPALSAAACARIIGGKVKYNHDKRVFTNFCCIRVSRALNLSGDPVKYFRDIGADGKTMKPAVSSGKDKRWHIFRVRSLRKYMEKTYGKGEPVPLSSYKTHLAGRKGIILYEVPGWDDASGHADCWEESRCLWRDFGDKAKVILFWDAP